MNTPLEAGGYYWIAFSWDALYLRTYQGYEGYDWTSFGVCHGGFSEAQVLPGTVSPSPTIYPYRQILITRDPVPWLSAPVGSGVLAPGQSDAYQVGLDAQGLPLGSVEANLRIDSDDLDEPRLRVPVILEVVESCAACLIDGACYAQGQTHPADVCLVCDVERSTDSWSDNDGVSCDDWSFCTVDDACAGGQCLGTGRDCDDGLFCTGVESCNEDGDRCESPGDPCPDDGLYCNGSESCDEEGDQCVHSGDPCTQDGVFCNGPEVCDEEGDQCLHAGNPCDDGLYCTGSEPCDEEGDLCPGTHTGDPCKAYECCIEESDTCEQIHFVLHHPDYHVSYPAGGGLEVSYEFSGSCLETVRIGAYFRVDGNPGEYMNLLEDAPPVHTFVWETPVVDWDDVHITYWYPGVGGQMDYFRLHVPHSPSIAYEPIDRETVIQWDGFVSDILVLEGPYDPSFAGADTAEAVTSPWTDADSDAGTAVEKYYRILNAGTQAAAPVDLGRRDVSIRQGYNLLAVPLRYDDELWASEVTADIVAQGGNVIELSKWDSSSGTWKTHDPAWPVVDFTILPGEGFFVRAGADSTWTVVGEVIRDTPVSIDTVYGYAMLGIPTWAYAMASDLAAGMIAQGCDPLEISRWVASAGVWETHDLSWPVVDFGIDAADGYLLRAGADATFVLEPMAVDAAVLSPTEARITFDTDVPGAAFLWVGTDPENLDDHAPDDRNFLFEGTDHVFTLIGLYSGQTYFFEIEFLGRIFRNGGEPYSFEMP